MLMKFFARLLLGMGFVLCLFKSVIVTVAWWQGRLVPGFGDWLWILALPLLVWIYLRYFSVLACRECERPERSRGAGPPDT